VRKILPYADFSTQVLIRLLFTTGMRVSEALSFDLSEVRDNEIWLTDTKFNKPRPVYINDKLYNDLKKLGKPLFPGRDGKQIDRKQAYFRIKTALTEAGYSDYSPHCFRHGYATELLGSGANLVSVSKSLGHANTETTEIYTHLVNDDVRRMHEAFMP